MKTNRLALREWPLCLMALLLIGCLLLEGCAGGGRPLGPPPVEVEATSPAPTPARDVLFSDQKPASGFGAYGYLLFTKRPMDDDLNRYITVCRAFVRNLEPVSDYPRSFWPTMMPTYWLAESLEKIDQSSPNCQQWVGFYDYSRAKTMASAVEVLSSDGPILVAWSQPFEEANGETALVLDLSDFSNSDLDRAFGIWMDRITRDPKIWHAGFNLVLIKEAFRNFLEKYGDHILNAVQTIIKIS